MSKLRVNCFGVSADGFGSGLNQSLQNPMGEGGMALHEWAFKTRTFQKMFGNEGGATGPDDDFAERRRNSRGVITSMPHPAVTATPFQGLSHCR